MNYDNWKLMSDRDEMSYADDGLEKCEVVYFLRQEGAENIDVTEGETTCDIQFDYDGAWYGLEDLSLDEFENMNRIKDMIDFSDDRGTICCDSFFDDDHRRCTNCQEAF